MSISPRENGLTRFFKPIWYRPSVQNMVGIGVGFKDLAINVNFKLRQNSAISARQGSSAYTNIHVHSYGRKLGYDIYYQKYRGYFIENLGNFVNGLFSGEELQQRDDLRLRNISTNVYYVFNPDRFSYRSAFVLDERQTRSGGSFILTGSLGYFKASADSSFIPPDTDIEFDPRAHFYNADFYTFAVSPGYAHNFIFWKNCYFSGGISGMIGLQYQQAQADNFRTKGVNYFLKGIVRSSLGYNAQKWVAGISMTMDIQGLNTEFMQFRSNNLDLGIFFAYRIKTRWMKGKTTFFGFLKKKKDKGESAKQEG
ncbi:MAG: DUF4421 family protein [Bacteroidota bacterium]